MNKLIILILFLLASSYIHAANNTTINNKQIEIEPSKDDKLFIREYTYSASEDDSKNSSRKKAIEQLKILLSEEIGTHIENYLEIKKQNREDISYQSVKNEISSLSASITKLNILNEKWDGKSYHVKASVRVNEKRTIELILQEIKSKSSDKDVQRLNAILKEQEVLLTQQSATIQGMNKKLVSQEIINEAKKNEITSMKGNLVKYQKEEIVKNREAKRIKSELDRKKILISRLNEESNNDIIAEKNQWKSTKLLFCSFETGTKKSDIETITGYPFFRYKANKSIVNGLSLSSLDGFGDIYSACPNKFLRSAYKYECMYFTFVNDLTTKKYGCDLANP